jgi:hypothetical protein
MSAPKAVAENMLWGGRFTRVYPLPQLQFLRIQLTYLSFDS